MRTTRLSLLVLLPIGLGACSQSHVDTPASQSYASIQEHIDQQACEKASRYHGHPVLGIFHQSETEEKYKACLKRRGYAVED